MELTYGIAILVALYVAFQVWDRWYRLVYTFTIPSSRFEECVTPWMRSGGKGHNVSIFHQPSGTMFLIRKDLPLNLPEAKVSFKVMRMRIPLAERYQPQRGRESVVGEWRFRWVPSRYLPSAKQGEVWERVNCGGSVKRTFEQVARLIREKRDIPEDAIFHVWAGVGRSWRRGSWFGSFED